MEKKDKKQISGTFRTGAICLAFLVIGFQSAMFINRAAVIHIEDRRDHPDTVYVIKEYPAAASATATATATVTTVRHDAVHSPRVEKVRAASRRAESFRFDPNTASVQDLQRLGFSEKQAAAIDRYRQKGGRFHRPADFARSYVVSDSIFRRLEPFIDIPRVNINTADSAALDALPGIGPVLAARIVAYRKEIGTFQSTEQLMDVKFFDRERYDALSDLVTCGGDGARE